MGSCYRVKHSLLLAKENEEERPKSFAEVVGDKHGFVKLCDPSKDAAQIYDKMTERYAILEEIVLQSTAK